MAKTNPKKPSHDRKSQAYWNGVLEREGLSMSRGRNRRLTYATLSEDTDSNKTFPNGNPLADESANPESILLAIEKVKRWTIADEA